MCGLTTNQQHVKLNDFLHSDLNVNVNIAALEALEHHWYVNHAVVYFENEQNKFVGTYLSTE